MDTSTRLHYLEAMGIDVWVPRKPLPLQADLKPPVPMLGAGNKAENDEADWEILENEVSGCRKCELCETRTQTVFGTGDKNADWLFIGEGPGQQEDLQGKPFVGKAGLLLTEMLRAIGLNRDDVFITNIVKCRPPNNRDPKPQEAESCSDYLERQFRLIRPKIIVALGRIAAQRLLKTDTPIGKLRSQIHHFHDTPVVIVYHPAYLLRSPTEKRKAWQDLLLALQIYNDNKS
jgi:uracil-DNA glycosylase family 4